MIIEEHFKFLNAEINGKYSPNSFFIQTSGLVDIFSETDDPIPGAIPTYAHEYVHYLHNVSTCAGLHIFIASLWLLRSLPHATNSYGHFLGESYLKDDQVYWIKIANTWLHALWGDTNCPDEIKTPQPVIKSWKFISFERGTFHLDLKTQKHEVGLVSAKVEITDSKKVEHKFTINIGYDFISEGVAYEVDREIRRQNGTPDAALDLQIPPFPYLAFRPMLDHLVGRKTTAQERIDLGVLSLLNSSPSTTLLDLCENIKREVIVLDKNLHLNTEVILTQTLEPELSSLGYGGVIREAAEEVFSLFKAGFKLRESNPVLEQNFINSTLDVNGFLNQVAKMLDCCVLQQKANKTVELLWIGPQTMAGNDSRAEKIGVFQAAIHFARLHFRDKSKTLSTIELPEVPCPFSGTCQTEIDDKYPDACKKRPWTRFQDVPSGQSMCWYATGVKLFIPVMATVR